MNIFLDDRIIHFSDRQPDNPSSSDLVVPFESEKQLLEEYRKLEGNLRYRKMIIVEKPGEMKLSSTGSSGKQSPAVESFFSLFTRVEAAGGLVKNEKGEYLFIFRLGRWDLPKGKIDKKDHNTDPKEERKTAAIREVKEETGLQTVEITRELPSTYHIYTIKDKTILKCTHWFEMSADSAQPLKPQTSERIFQVKWTPPKAVHGILSLTYASLREILLEEIF